MEEDNNDFEPDLENNESELGNNEEFDNQEYNDNVELLDSIYNDIKNKPIGKRKIEDYDEILQNDETEEKRFSYL